MCVYICVCVGLPVSHFACECRYLRRPEDVISSPGVEVTGGYESLDMDT